MAFVAWMTMLVLLLSVQFARVAPFLSQILRNSKLKPKAWYGTQRYPTSSSKLQMGLIDSFKQLVVGQDFTEGLKLTNDKVLKTYMQRVESINSLEASVERLSDTELCGMTEQFRVRLKQGENLDTILEEAFAVVREASWRVLELRHFDVQLIGGMALHDGKLAEMATGEGKTLAAVLALYLNALTGDGVYVVTPNDYLAQRDGQRMGQVYRFLGLSVGVVQAGQTQTQRQAAYSCDVTYLSNQELGFDFLRDNLAMAPGNIVQARPYHFCIVDEADSILIDEARTPLIISRPGASASPKYTSAATIVAALIPGRHYTVDRKTQRVDLTSAGYGAVEKILGKSLFDLQDPWAFYILNAVKARELLQRDQQYIVQPDGTVSLVDAFTGRVLPGRRFSDGLQQAVEAKENLALSADTQVVAQVTYQFLFRLFPKLAGMTGTAMTDSAELFDTYQLSVFPVPTALPVARRDHPDAVFRTAEGKMRALLRNVLARQEKGQPVLIGTTSVEASEELVQALRDLGISAALLNARPENAERESLVVAQAGRLGAVTVATNMAGRGTDIVLGGSGAATVGALIQHLLLQRMGLTPAAQQLQQEDELKLSSPVEGDSDDNASVPAAAEEGASLLVAVAQQLDLWLPKIPTKDTEAALHAAIAECASAFGTIPADPTAQGDIKQRLSDLVTAAVEGATPTSQPSAQRLRAVVQLLLRECDDVLKVDRETVRNLGGLYVVGTARHESRRIDNQLRGRAGRQGDPGASRFFLSLEDEIFRVFGADKMAALMESFRVGEDLPIESDLVTKALDKVQGQVEDHYRGVRQQVYRLDEVAARQRAVVYSQRRAFLTSTDEGMLSTLDSYCMQTIDDIHAAAVASAAVGKGLPKSAVNATKLCTKVLQFFPNMVIGPGEVAATPADRLVRLLHVRLEDAIRAKRAQIGSHSPPPSSSAAGTPAAWQLPSFFRQLLLVQMDEAWSRHLTRLQLLQEEMLLQSFSAERDVMVTYRARAQELFAQLMDTVRRNAVYSLFAYNPSGGS